jgi:regulator of protease activity HflC (stomatin/prohibitin superfamily)
MLILGIVVGAILLVLAWAVRASGRDSLGPKAARQRRAGAGLLTAAFVAVAAGVVLGTFRIVPGGSVGVQTLFGRIYDEPLGEGLSVINPLKQVTLLSVRTQEMTEHAGVPSREGLSVGLEVTVLYHLEASAAPSVLRTHGRDYASVFILPQLRSVIRGATVNHEAKALYTSGRELISQEIHDVLQGMLEARGVVLEKVLLRKIVLPKMVEEAINSKLAAEQEAERMRFVLLKEQQEAERKRVEAGGIADFQRIVSQGISEPLLKWKAIEVAHDLSRSPNAKLIVLGDKSGLPIFLSDR